MLTLSHFTTRVPKSLPQWSRFQWSGGLEGSGLSEGVFRFITHRIFLLFSSTLHCKSSMQPVFSHCILPGMILYSVLPAILLVWVLKSPILYLSVIHAGCHHKVLPFVLWALYSTKSGVEASQVPWLWCPIWTEWCAKCVHLKFVFRCEKNATPPFGFFSLWGSPINSFVLVLYFLSLWVSLCFLATSHSNVSFYFLLSDPHTKW